MVFRGGRFCVLRGVLWFWGDIYGFGVQFILVGKVFLTGGRSVYGFWAGAFMVFGWGRLWFWAGRLWIWGAALMGFGGGRLCFFFCVGGPFHTN